MSEGGTVEVPELVTWPGIELVAVGEWALSTGTASVHLRGPG